MSAERLSDRAVRSLEPPASGNRITYDAEVKGFGVRATAAGAKAFVLNYRAGGRERRITIGSASDWTVGAARDAAKGLKRRIDQGEDPMGQRHEDRAAPTINSLADRFEEEYLPKRRPATQTDYRSILRLYIRKDLGKMKVADIRHADIERLHHRIAKTAPYRANRTVAVLSKMLAQAVKWEMRGDNPARGVDRADEEKRERFLSPAEILRLVAALDAHKEKTSCNAVRLLLLTGARRGETLSARWAEINFDTGVWSKPSAHTKTKKIHHVPLSAPALTLLAAMKAEAGKDHGPAPEYVFPGAAEGKPLREIKRVWLSICRDAGLAEHVERRNRHGALVTAWRSTVRIHDLRHTYASILVSAGLSLPIIGALLGHTQAQTTHRYAHLLDDPLRAATERAGAIISGKSGAEIVPIRQESR